MHARSAQYQHALIRYIFDRIKQTLDAELKKNVIQTKILECEWSIYYQKLYCNKLLIVGSHPNIYLNSCFALTSFYLFYGSFPYRFSSVMTLF